jgi:heptosyltransferase I
MGDIIHAIPAVTALRKALPEAKFGWIVEKRWAELLQASEPASDSTGTVDWVHTVDTRRWRQSFTSAETRSEIRTALKEVRQRKYDAAIDFQSAVKSAVIARLSGAARRFGYAKPWERPAAMFYSDKVPTSSVHVVERGFDLAEAFARAESGGVVDRNGCACLPRDSGAEKKVNAFIQEFGLGGRFAILNPGAGWGAKQWPAERYAEVARTLGREGVRSLVNFGPGEESLAQQVEQQAEGHAIAAQFTISQLIAVTRHASFFIGGDTGPLHLAAALKIPVVALFGPTDPARTGPYGTRSIVLRDPNSVTSHKRIRDTEAGLMNIFSEQVIAAARQLLNEAKS